MKMDKENNENEFFWAYAVERDRKENTFVSEWNDYKKERGLNIINEKIEEDFNRSPR
jgi:hypothetical protein